jgi:hypothetical protein
VVSKKFLAVSFAVVLSSVACKRNAEVPQPTVPAKKIDIVSVYDEKVTVRVCVGDDVGSRRIRCVVEVAGGPSVALRSEHWKASAVSTFFDGGKAHEIKLPGAQVVAPEYLTGLGQIVILVPEETDTVYLFGHWTTD